MAVIKNVLGTSGADILRNAAEIEIISGGEGLDKLVFDEGTKGVTVDLTRGTIVDSFGNKDQVSGVEIIIGTSFNDKITGSANADYLAGAAGNDMINGLAGFDELYGGEGNDTLNGGEGSDFLVAGQGNDVINGGSGFDTADYSDEGGAGITVDLLAGQATDNYGGTDKLVSIERIRASDYVDTLLGSNGANMLDGFGGDDSIDGRSGNDTLLGGFGNDSVLGGAGADVIVGGRGEDMLDGGSGSLDVLDYSQDGGWRSVAVNLQTGFAEDSWGDLDRLTNIENVIGTNLADWIHGSKATNTITGGAGDDTVTGGGGNDVFKFATTHGNDHVMDFNAGDRLDLSGLGFTSLDQVLAAAEGHELGALIVTGEGSTIVLVDVNINAMATLGYIFA